MSTADVLAALDDVDVSGLWVAQQPDVVPQAPPGPWVLVPLSDGGTLIGGADRGTFGVYGVYDDDAAVRALRHLLGPPAPQRQLGEAERRALADDAARLAQDLAHRCAAGHVLSSRDVPVGTALDHIGADSGRTAFLYNTPFSHRSAPPTDLELPRTGYLVRQPLPDTTSVSPVVAWFGQPGGGILVAFERPLRHLVDTGHLEPFAA